MQGQAQAAPLAQLMAQAARLLPGLPPAAELQAQLQVQLQAQVLVLVQLARFVALLLAAIALPALLAGLGHRRHLISLQLGRRLLPRALQRGTSHNLRLQQRKSYQQSSILPWTPPLWRPRPRTRTVAQSLRRLGGRTRCRRMGEGSLLLL